MEFFHIISKEGISFPIPLENAKIFDLFKILELETLNSYQIDFSAKCIHYALYHVPNRLPPTLDSLLLIIEACTLMDYLGLKGGDPTKEVLNGGMSLAYFEDRCLGNLQYIKNIVFPKNIEPFPIMPFDFFIKFSTNALRLYGRNMTGILFNLETRLNIADRLMENVYHHFNLKSDSERVKEILFQMYMIYYEHVFPEEDPNSLIFGITLKKLTKQIADIDEEWVKEWKMLMEDSDYIVLQVEWLGYLSRHFKRGTLSKFLRLLKTFDIAIVIDLCKELLASAKERFPDVCSSCKRRKVDTELFQDVESKLLYCSISCQSEHYAKTSIKRSK